MFDTIKDELVAMMDERFRTIQSDLEASRPRTREVTFCEFCARGAPDFSGKKEPIFSMWWIADVASAFLTSFLPDEAKVRFATCLIREGAQHCLGGVGWSALLDQRLLTLWLGGISSPGWGKSVYLLLRCSSWPESSRLSSRPRRGWLRSPPNLWRMDCFSRSQWGDEDDDIFGYVEK